MLLFEGCSPLDVSGLPSFSDHVIAVHALVVLAVLAASGWPQSPGAAPVPVRVLLAPDVVVLRALRGVLREALRGVLRERQGAASPERHVRLVQAPRGEPHNAVGGLWQVEPGQITPGRPQPQRTV